MRAALLAALILILPLMSLSAQAQSASPAPTTAAAAAIDIDIDITVEEMQTVAPQAIEQIVDTVVVLYAQRFTKEEMLEIAAFYKTPVGQKAIRELLPLMLEASKLGQTIGQRLGQEAGQRAFAHIQKEGIKLPRR